MPFNKMKKEATKALISLGFGELALHKIFARAFAHNPASWRIMEKLGMGYEGTFKEQVYRFREFVDVKFYGLLIRKYLERNLSDE